MGLLVLQDPRELQATKDQQVLLVFQDEEVYLVQKETKEEEVTLAKKDPQVLVEKWEKEDPRELRDLLDHQGRLVVLEILDLLVLWENRVQLV